MQKQWRSIALLLWAASASTTPAFATTPTTAPDLFALPLETLMQVRITTSTLTDETLQSVPASVTVYSRRQIRQLGVRRLEDLMNLVPGYQSNRSDSSSLNRVYSGRGRRLGNAGAEVLVLLDGQRLNGDWNGGATLYDTAVSLENIERVEFIRGPGSTVYGSNAIMGVVNVITRSEREVHVSAGSHQSRQASAQWYAGDDERNVQLFAQQRENEGEALHIYDPYQTATIDSRDPSRSQDLHLRGQWGEFRGTLRHTQRDSEQFYTVGFVENEENLVDTESTYLNVGWHRALGDGLTLDASLFHADRQYHVRSAALLSPYVLVDGGIKEREPGVRLLLQDDTGDQRWLAGWEFRRPELYDTAATVNNAPRPQAPEDHRNISGYFGQYQHRFSDSTQMIFGARTDDYSDFGSHTSPRIGVIHRINDSDTLKLLYSEAFRAPSRIETSVMNSGAFARNADLDPEVAKTQELIWLHGLSHGQFSSTLFHTDVQDAIHEVAAGNTGNLRTWRNGHETVGGLELEWEQTLSESWSTRLAATYLFDEPVAINSEAGVLFGGSLVYQQQRWLVSLRANYQGDRRDSTEESIPADANSVEYREHGGRTIFGLHAAFTPIPSLEIYADADNLFNHQYNSAASRYTNTEGVPERGLTMTVGLRWTYD